MTGDTHNHVNMTAKVHVQIQNRLRWEIVGWSFLGGALGAAVFGVLLG